MKRALAALALVVLATAAPAGAAGPGQPGVGPGVTVPAQPRNPLQTTVELTPPVALFGDTVTARVSVVADTTRVDPTRIHVSAKFAPYTPLGPPQKVQVGGGRYVLTTWTWKLHCITAACVPVAPPSDVYHDFSFPPVQVRAVGIDGKTPYKTHVFMPQLQVNSQVSPREKAHIEKYKHIDWLYQATPAGTAYTLAPGLVFWIAVALAVLCAAAAVVLAVRLAIRIRSPHAAQAGVPGSYLERALALFFWANAHGDETLQRKALERVADELPLDELDLSEVARELAWSRETPEGEAVEAISQHAGVERHDNGGMDE
jgi:hypothetical protein